MTHSNAARNAVSAGCARVIRALSRTASIQKFTASFNETINYWEERTVCHSRVRIPVIQGIRCEASEPWLGQLLSLLLPHRDGTFLDVGANLGQTMIKVKALEPARKYIGFEPNPTCVFYLNQLLSANGFRECTVVPAGLSNKSTLLALQMFSTDPADSTATVVSDFRPAATMVSHQLVPVFEFSTLASQIGCDSVGFLKIDVEGGELEVIETLAEAIRRDRPLILLEVLPVYSPPDPHRISRQGKLEQIVRHLGYKASRIQKSETDDYKDIQSISSFGIHSDLRQCDYLLAPEERAHDLLTHIRG